MEITLEDRRRLSNQFVELNKIGLPRRIEIEIGLQTVCSDTKHQSLDYPTGIQTSTVPATGAGLPPGDGKRSLTDGTKARRPGHLKKFPGERRST